MVDETDKKILNLMIQNPEVTQKDIASSLKITPPAVHSRIQRLKAKKIIKGTMPVLDLDKLGYDITIVAMVIVKNGKLREAGKKWAKDRNVCAVYRITGKSDLVIIAKFKNTKELNSWNQRIVGDTANIDRVNTSIVFEGEKDPVTPNEIE